MKNYNRIKAHELAVDANSQFAKGLGAEIKKKYFEVQKNIIVNKTFMALAIFLSVLYLSLVAYDGYIMSPILRVIITSGLGMKESWLPSFIGFYIVIAMSFAYFISIGFLKKMNKRSKEMEVEFAQISSPEKGYSEIKSDVEKESKRDFAISMIMFLVFIAVIFVFALTRNYLNPAHQFKVQIQTPTDWTSIIIPVMTAIAMLLTGIYKGTILKFIGYSLQVKKYTDATNSFFAKAQNLGQQAMEYEFEAEDVFEGTIRSKELNDVIERYSNTSSLKMRQQEIFVKVQQKGMPVPNCPVQGITLKSERIYSVTNTEGFATLGWNVDEFLKKVFINNSPLEGDRFNAGQIIMVDLDSLMPPKDNNNNSTLMN